MASKKDPRRLNLVVPYQEPAASAENAEVSTTMASAMPMAAMLTRNRLIGWGAVAYSVVSWLGESEEARKSTSTPGYISIAMSFGALAMTYLPLFMPQPGQQTVTSTGPPAPVPLA